MSSRCWLQKRISYGNLWVEWSWPVDRVDRANCSDLWMERCWLVQRNHCCDLLVKWGWPMEWASGSDQLVTWCCLIKRTACYRWAGYSSYV